MVLPWRLRWFFTVELMSGESYSGLLKMTNIARNTLRRLAAETRGSEIAEAAAVLPLMFMILIGIFWFGQAFSIYGTITRAAQDGARAAAAPALRDLHLGATPPAQNAYNAVRRLIAAHLNSSQIIPPSNWTLRPRRLSIAAPGTPARPRTPTLETSACIPM